MKNWLIVLLALNFCGCATVAQKALEMADKVKVPAFSTETDLGCKRLVNDLTLPSFFTEGQKDGVEPIWATFFLVIDEERAADSVIEFRIDLNKEIPLFQSGCVEVTLVCDTNRDCHYRVATTPRKSVDELGNGWIAQQEP